MKNDNRVLIVLAVNGLLVLLIGQVNTLLAPLALHVSVPIIYLVFSALYLRMSQTFAVAVISGFAVDATLPVAFGCHGVLFLLAYALILRIRLRLRRENHHHVIFLSLGANFLIFAGLTLTTGLHGLMMAHSLLRLGADLLLSQMLLAAITAPIVAAQRRLLLLFHIDIASELQTL